MKKLNEESSTAPSLRQNNALGQHSSATIPHNDASSGQNTTIRASPTVSVNLCTVSRMNSDI